MMLKYIAECFSGQPLTHKYPYCLVSIVVSPGEIDANLEPNKTQVLLKDEVCTYLDDCLYRVLVCLLIWIRYFSECWFVYLNFYFCFFVHTDIRVCSRCVWQALDFHGAPIFLEPWESIWIRVHKIYNVCLGQGWEEFLINLVLSVLQQIW